MSEFTPGPWNVDPNYPSDIQANGNEIAATVGSGDIGNNWVIGGKSNVSLDEKKANARLIAAAPELLDALEKFAAIEIGSDSDCRVEIVPNGYSDPIVWRQHVAAARAAIAKALGKEEV